MPGRIVLQQPAVLLQRGPAARRVHDDDVRAGALERGDVPPREGARAIALTRVRVEGTAAGLVLDDGDLYAVAREDARGRRVRRPEDRALHAAAEEGRAGASGAMRRDGAREPLARRGLVGDELQEPGETSRGVRDRADGAKGRAGAEALRQVGETRERGQRAPVGEQCVERDEADDALAQRGVARGHDLRARALDELPELDARRAGCLARAAVEAGVHVVVESGGVGPETAFPHVLHQADASARGVHLDPEDREGRARRQAEAAVHAPRDQVLGRRVRVRVRQERKGRDGRGGLGPPQTPHPCVSQRRSVPARAPRQGRMRPSGAS